MIIDSIESADKYAGIHPGFAKAFEYLKSTDLKSVEDGTYEIADGVRGVMTDKKGKTAEDSLSKFEAHKKYIDIQVCVRGKEQLGWKPLAKCKKVKVEYNQEKDVTFYDESPDTFFELSDNQFAIFFPEDAHAAMIGVDDNLIKKLVLKIRI